MHPVIYIISKIMILIKINFLFFILTPLDFIMLEFLKIRQTFIKIYIIKEKGVLNGLFIKFK